MSLLSLQWLSASLRWKPKSLRWLWLALCALIPRAVTSFPTCSLCSFHPSHMASPPLHWLSSLPQTMAWLIPSPLLSLLSNHLLSGVSSDCSISYGNLSSYLSFPIRTLVQRPEAETFVSFVYECFPSA